MKYFGIIDKNVATIFQLEWKIGNISDMFLQYSVLYGKRFQKIFEKTIYRKIIRILHENLSLF